MTLDERAEIEAKADRCRRRGELGPAIALYRSIAAAFPDDLALQEKLGLLQENLQPLELQHPKANLAERPSALPLTTEQRAEEHVQRGELTEAVALYRTALRDRPDNTLLADRLAEVFGMLRQQSGAAPSPPAGVTAPSKSPPAPLTASWDRADTLRNLLERVASRRRG